MKLFLVSALFILIGAIAGYTYYYFIGCNAANACAITSNPIHSTLYGALLGGVVGLNFLPQKKKNNSSDYTGNESK